MSQKSETTTAQDSNSFRPVEGGTKTTDVGLFFGVAYCLFWALLFGFVATTWRKQRSLSTRLERVERSLAKSEP